MSKAEMQEHPGVVILILGPLFSQDLWANRVKKETQTTVILTKMTFISFFYVTVIEVTDMIRNKRVVGIFL